MLDTVHDELVQIAEDGFARRQLPGSDRWTAAALNAVEMLQKYASGLGPHD